MHKAPALVQNAKVSLKHPMAGGVDVDGRLGEDQHHLADGSWPPVPPSARALEASPGRWLRDVLIGQDPRRTQRQDAVDRRVLPVSLHRANWPATWSINPIMGREATEGDELEDLGWYLDRAFSRRATTPAIRPKASLSKVIMASRSC